MAFLGKVGNLIKQSVSKNINSGLSASNPSMLQAIRCMSSSKVFIGGLSYGTDDQSLREAFTSHGEVIEARVIVDRETGRSRGFGFVSYTSSEEASNAIAAMDGQDLHGRRIRVNYANDRTGGFRGGAGGYGGGGGGYGGGAGGYGGGGYGGAGGYGSGGGGGYGGAGGYGSGGGSSYGGGYGGDSYGTGGAAGGGGYNAGGGYGGGSTSDGSGSVGYGTGSAAAYGGDANGYSAPVGSGYSSPAGNGDFGSGGASTDGGYTGGVGYSGSTGSPLEQPGSSVPGGYGQDAPLEGNFKNADEESGDVAERRAW